MARIHIKLDNIPAAANSKACRNRIDLLKVRADILVGRDRALMKMYLEDGIPFRRIAQVAGVNEATIARRICKLTKKLLDSEYITCLRNRNRFTRTEQLIARDYFLLGLSQKKIADKRNITIYGLRKTLTKIQQLVKITKAS